MAISTTYQEIQGKFNPHYWKSFEEFEEYYLLNLAEGSKFNYNYYTNKEGVEIKIPTIDHHPVLKEYEVWMSGYAATGESAQAHLVGKAFARNFRQACHIVMCRDFLAYAEKINDPNHTEYEDPARWDYDPNRLTYWACGLYWSEELARKQFG